jgi:hypothetical protein
LKATVSPPPSQIGKATGRSDASDAPASVATALAGDELLEHAVAAAPQAAAATVNNRAAVTPLRIFASTLSHGARLVEHESFRGRRVGVRLLSINARYLGMNAR